MWTVTNEPPKEVVTSHPPEQMKCRAGCGKVRHEYSHAGPKGPVYTCCRCGAERTK